MEVLTINSPENTRFSLVSVAKRLTDEGSRSPFSNSPRRRIALAVALLTVGLTGLRFHALPAMAAGSFHMLPQVLPEGDSDQPGDAGNPATTEDESQPAPADGPGDQDGGSAATRIVPSSRGGARSPVPSPDPSPDLSSEAAPSTGDRIVSIAQQLLGYQYFWGGSSPRTGFDCTGFTWYVYKEAGVDIPNHDLWGQLRAGPRIAFEDLRPGDLVFFENTYQWGLSHSGLYVGDGKFIDANAPGVGVVTGSLEEGFWKARFVGGSRPW